MALDFIDPVHSVFKGELIGFTFRSKHFVEPIMMR